MSADETKDPLDLFSRWMGEAEQTEPSDPNAMVLATVAADGRPSARVVLLKGADEEGFVFYTNLGSRKVSDLNENANVALCFHWKSLRKQVRIEGAVSPVSDDEADAYFASRPRESRIGAWASKQSQPLEGRFELEAQIAKFGAKFNVGAIPRPEFWSGFRLVPERIEFWQDKPFRLHDRLVFHRDGDGWTTEKLYP
jgi:pyridoxamine 5'-phosphate oxidase